MVPVESCTAQLEAMQSSKQSDSERDFERDSAGNAKALSNPTTLARAPAPTAIAGAVFASVAEIAKACSSGDFEYQGPSSDFERPVAAEHGRAVTSSASTPCAMFSSAAERFPILPGADSSGGFNICVL